MPDDLTTDTYGYTRREWLALPTRQRQLVEQDAAAAGQAALQAELQAELDASTEDYFATDEWQLDLDDDCFADAAQHSHDDWLQDLEGVI